ncbi:MAG TPA: GntR family transcriptional regulator [Acidimicrobiales bacterium]|nr:GntR family transcriptional regulator [Acidimicrobiales bacterium]
MSPLIRFRLDPRSGLVPSRQLVEQVRRAINLGRLRAGDQLPSVREVVGQIPINPNTVHRAYRDLEQLGLVEGRPGSGTFVAAGIGPAIEHGTLEPLLAELRAWLGTARAAGLDAEAVLALVATALDPAGDDLAIRS